MIRADVVTEWNQAVAAVVSDLHGAQHAEIAARAFALMHCAISDALETAVHSGSSTGVGIAAASRAAHDVVVELFPRAERAANALHRADLAPLPEPERSAGAALGQRVARAWLEQRTNDGWPVLKAPSDAELLAPLSRATEALKSPWRNMRPFALKSVTQFAVRQPFWFDAGGDLVPDLGLRNTRLVAPDAAPVGRIWSVDAVPAWNRVACGVLVSAVRDERQRAAAFAHLNVALADALISAAHARFVFANVGIVVGGRVDQEYMKDMIAITDLEASGPGGRLAIRLRNHPSLEATVAGAAQQILLHYLGGDRPITVMDAASRRTDAIVFPRLTDAAKRASAEESLTGRCTHEAAVAGYKFGMTIGDFAVKHTPVRRN